MKTVFIAIEDFAKQSDGAIKILESKGFKILYNHQGTQANIKSHQEEYLKADYIIAGLENYSDIFFKRFKNVKAISRVGVGVDSIDLNSARENSVKIFITSDRPSVAVAELCISNMISLLRHTYTMSNNLKSNHWTPIQGKELRSCTIGIIGLGSIGKEVAKRASVFGSKLLGYGRTWNNEFANSYNIQRKSLEDIFKVSNIVTIHLPFTSETNKLINREIIALAKPDSIILNTSRAGVMDNNALAEALKLNQLGGAAIDVFEEEKDPQPYTTIENVILTPHIGSHTHETRKAMEEMAVENIVIYDSLLSDGEDLKISEYVNKHSV
jgi:D-3-phosphoglycerate dehydrogenase